LAFPNSSSLIGYPKINYYLLLSMSL